MAAQRSLQTAVTAAQDLSKPPAAEGVLLRVRGLISYGSAAPMSVGCEPEAAVACASGPGAAAPAGGWSGWRCLSKGHASLAVESISTGCWTHPSSAESG